MGHWNTGFARHAAKNVSLAIQRLTIVPRAMQGFGLAWKTPVRRDTILTLQFR